MSIRVSKDPRPLAWAAVNVVDDEGNAGTFRARFVLFGPKEAGAIQQERFRLAKAAQVQDHEDMTTRLIDALSAEAIDQQAGALNARLIGWDLEDEAGEPYPFNDDNRSAIIDHPSYFRPLWDALVEASLGGARGNG